MSSVEEPLDPAQLHAQLAGKLAALLDPSGQASAD